MQRRCSPPPDWNQLWGIFRLFRLQVFIPGFLFYPVLINLFIWRSGACRIKLIKASF